MRAIAHAQRAVAIPGDETEPRIFSDQTVDTGQQAADGAGGTGVVMPAVALAPGAEDFYPGIAAVIGGCRGIEQITLTQAFADGIAQVTAVVDQQRADRRMNLTGQLLEGLLRDGSGRRQQQGFIERIARAQLLGSGSDGTLVRGLADAGEGRGVALYRQLDASSRVVERAADEQVVRQDCAKPPFDAASCLQDVV